MIDTIQYDPEQILNGFTEESLKELAKRLKRKINPPKNDIIPEIISPAHGKGEDRVKIWQEINRHLRKELEALPEETFLMYSAGNVSSREQFKVGYMFTLSADPEIKARGEELYCQAQENKELENDEALTVIATMPGEIETEPVKEGSQIDEKLQKRIKTLGNKLRKANLETLRTKGQLEKLKNEMIAIKVQWMREKEEAGKFRNRVTELEGERAEIETEIRVLKLKLEHAKTLIPSKAREQAQRRDLQKGRNPLSGEFDLAAFQGRKALIFAERDHEIETRLSSLGIIPIWAMEIDWNRPRRRMSTCELVLYKQNDKKIEKLDEIRDVARYWNIPCSELLNTHGRIVND